MALPRASSLASTPFMGLVFFAALAGALGAAMMQRSASMWPLLTVGLLGASALLFVSRYAKALKDADQTLDQSERYIQVVAQLSHDIHLLIDPFEGSVLYANDAFVRVTGQETEVLQRGGVPSLHALVHPSDQPRLGELLEMGQPAMGEPPTREASIRVMGHDGAWHHHACRAQVFHCDAEGRVREILLVATDVSGQRSVESLLPRLTAYESLGSITGAVVHDLNNALMNIQVQAEGYLVEHGSLDGLYDLLSQVQQETRRASELSRQLLLCAGQGRGARTPQHLNEVLREALPMAERRIPDTVRFNVHLDSELPDVFADPVQIRHALLVMVSTSLLALDGRDGSLTLRTSLAHLDANRNDAPWAHEGTFACLEMEDDGEAFPEGVLQACSTPELIKMSADFEPGLLALHWIAREHKGVLDMSRTSSGGNRFRLLLPLAGAMPDAPPKAETAPTLPLRQVVLLAEDEPVLRGALRQGLEEAGYDVLEAKDGVDGFACFVRNRERISAAIVDLTMPRLNGDQLFEEIHRIAPEVPVVLMSGYASGPTTERLMTKGLAGFVSKPCGIRVVRDALEKALGASQRT